MYGNRHSPTNIPLENFSSLVLIKIIFNIVILNWSCCSDERPPVLAEERQPCVYWPEFNTMIKFSQDRDNQSHITSEISFDWNNCPTSSSHRGHSEHINVQNISVYGSFVTAFFMDDSNDVVVVLKDKDYKLIIYQFHTKSNLGYLIYLVIIFNYSFIFNTKYSTIIWNY